MATPDIKRLTTVLHHISMRDIDDDVLIDRYFQLLTEITIDLGDILKNYDEEHIRYDRQKMIDTHIEKGWWERPFEDERDTDIFTMALQMAQMLKFNSLTKEK